MFVHSNLISEWYVVEFYNTKKINHIEYLSQKKGKKCISDAIYGNAWKWTSQKLYSN